MILHKQVMLDQVIFTNDIIYIKQLSEMRLFITEEKLPLPEIIWFSFGDMQ